jgi:hypothetical protein
MPIKVLGFHTRRREPRFNPDPTQTRLCRVFLRGEGCEQGVCLWGPVSAEPGLEPGRSEEAEVLTFVIKFQHPTELRAEA